MTFKKELTQEEVRILNAEKSRKWRAENPEKHRENSRKSYHKNRPDLKKKYGITKEELDQRIEMQDGSCCICGESVATHVDHNHDTGAVRDILCHQCNTGIGMLKDNPDVLRAAADYLEDHEQRAA